MARLLYPLILLVTLHSVVFATDAETIVPAEVLARKWVRTKSLTAPAETLRKAVEIVVHPPAAAPVVETKVDAFSSATFHNIGFPLNGAKLSGRATFAQLDEIAKAMQIAAGERFLIEGHTCDLGTPAGNLAISGRRALAVRAYLISRGIAPDRLQAVACGQADPVAPNTSEDSRARNRRVQIFRRL